MDSDTRRLVGIATLVVLVPLAIVVAWNWRERGRPVLREVRVVTASDSDPTFRDGARHLDPGEGYRLAVALKVEQRGKGTFWLSPARDLVLDGRPVEHEVADRWPESDRVLRVFWSTIECSYLGGELRSANAKERLVWRTFLAPELGRGMTADGTFEAHNDDFLGQLPPPPDPPPGTLRFYARVEVAEESSSLKALQAASSLGPAELWNPSLPVVSRALRAPEGIDPSVGELFLLPGFEVCPDDPGARAAILGAAGHPLAELTASRLATTSWLLAAVAVSGSPELDRASLEPLGKLRLNGPLLESRGRTLSWGGDVRPGDLLELDRHWMVLHADDGDGHLSAGDLVLHCWGRPPVVVPMLDALDLGASGLALFRHGSS